jgi:glycosyltransferase involved in cell wall biosynthesis
MKDYFIYVSQIPRNGPSGQNKFEKCFIEALLKKGDEGQKFDIKVFSTSMEGEKAEDERIVLIPLSKKNYTGYIFHQIRLFCSLGNFLWAQRKNNLTMFIRYHNAMLAPLVLTWLFNIPLSMRSGPVLADLYFFKKNPSKILFLCMKWVLGLFYKKASAIVTVTEKIKQSILKDFKLDPSKIVVVPNAADTTLFFPEARNSKKWNLPENEFVFGFVGRIYETQGLGTVFHALGLLKNNKKKVPLLFMVGEGDYRPALESLSKELDIEDRIIWAGLIPHAEVRSAINSCDMMLAPFLKRSLELKGSSALKLWEYLACDKPILASASNDHQFLDDLKLGKTVEPDNIELWAKILAQAAEGGGFLLQGRGQKLALDEHSYGRVVDKFISISFGPKMV